MNDQTGETPNPFSTAPMSGAGPNPNPSASSSPISPSNFGARPAQRPEMAAPTMPTPSMDNVPQGMSTNTFQNNTGATGVANTSAGQTPPVSVNNTSTPVNSAPVAGGAAEINAMANGTIGVGANPTSGAAVEDPLKRPMEKAAPAMPAPAKPKVNKGLIIGIVSGVAALIVIVVVGVVVALALNKPDPVVGAIEKILNGQAPANLQINGNVAFDTTDENSPASHYEMTVSASGMPNSLINEATITLPLGEEFGDATVELNEVYPGNQDLYLRVDGVTAALEGLSEHLSMQDSGEITYLDECEEDDVECLEQMEELENSDEEYIDDEVPYEDEVTEEGEIVEEGTVVDPYDLVADNPLLTMALMLAQNVEGEWIKFSLGNTTEDEEAINVTDMIGDDTMGGSSDFTCTVGLINTLRNNTSSVAGLYRKSPFIGSTQENVTLKSKNFPVYQVVIDQEKLTEFINAAQSAGLLKDYFSCSGQNASELTRAISNLPTIYTEVDSELNFTRVYLKGNNNGTTVTADLGLSYPTNINVPEPTEYLDFEEAMTEIFSGMFSEEGYEEKVTIDNNGEV